MIAEQIVLPMSTWEFLRERTDCEQHPALCPPPGSVEQPAGQRVRAQLHDAGLLHGHEPDAGLLAAMRLLGSAPAELHGWWGQRGESTRALAAAVIASLPAAAMARAETVEVAESEYTAALAGRDEAARVDIDGVVSVLQDNARTPARRAAEAVRRVLNRPRNGGGQFFAAVRDRLGRHAVSIPVAYVDTAEGRWLMGKRRDGSGQRRVVLAPGSADALGQWLTGLLAGLTR